MRWVLCAVALAGCDSLFGIDRVGPYDCPLTDDDCDQLIDSNDPCPADPGDNADRDGDGIGDVCDPNVTQPIDALLEFESFTSLDPRWTERTVAAWEVRDSALVLASGAVERKAPMNSQPTVEVLVDPTYGADGATVGVLVASKMSTGVPLECFVEHHADGDDLVMVVGDRASPGHIARAELLPGSPSDGLRIYGGQLTNGVVRCRARYGESDALYVDWVFWSTPVDFDTIGFRTENASAAYRSLAIYTTP
jgi:hypothetical protein